MKIKLKLDFYANEMTSPYKQRNTSISVRVIKIAERHTQHVVYPVYHVTFCSSCRSRVFSLYFSEIYGLFTSFLTKFYFKTDKEVNIGSRSKTELSTPILPSSANLLPQKDNL